MDTDKKIECDPLDIDPTDPRCPKKEGLVHGPEVYLFKGQTKKLESSYR